MLRKRACHICDLKPRAGPVLSRASLGPGFQPFLKGCGMRVSGNIVTNSEGGRAARSLADPSPITNLCFLSQSPCRAAHLRALGVGRVSVLC